MMDGWMLNQDKEVGLVIYRQPCYRRMVPVLRFVAPC